MATRLQLSPGGKVTKRSSDVNEISFAALLVSSILVHFSFDL